MQETDLDQNPLMTGDLDEIDRRKQEHAIRRYSELLRHAETMAVMTSTNAWADYWQHIQNRIAEHSRDVLNIDASTKEIIGHQRGVMIYREFEQYVKKPIAAIDDFLGGNPLYDRYLKDIKRNVTFDQTKGSIVIS